MIIFPLRRSGGKKNVLFPLKSQNFLFRLRCTNALGLHANTFSTWPGSISVFLMLRLLVPHLFFSCFLKGHDRKFHFHFVMTVLCIFSSFFQELSYKYLQVLHFCRRWLTTLGPLSLCWRIDVTCDKQFFFNNPKLLNYSLYYLLLSKFLFSLLLLLVGPKSELQPIAFFIMYINQFGRCSLHRRLFENKIFGVLQLCADWVAEWMEWES